MWNSYDMAGKSKISIRAQVFFALMTIVIIMAAIFSPYGFYTNVHSIRKSVDECLLIAANGALEILPEDYHQRLKRGEVSESEYAQIQRKFCDFKDRIGITYVYAMLRDSDGKVYFSADTDYKPMTLYEEPTPDVIRAFETGKIQVGQGEDPEFAIVSRSVLIPVRMRDGDTFVIGADLSVSKVYPIIMESLRNFMLLLMLGVALVFIVTVKLTRRISTPIAKLADFTKKLSDSDFSRELQMKDYVSDSILKAGEVQALASNISLMRSKLEEYIGNLEREAEARTMAESELEIAGKIQKSFLPGGAFEAGGIRASAAIRPAKQAGGDFYDFFTLSDGRLCFAIGDVSGKGMPAALFMARAITLVRAASKSTSKLSDIVAFINDILASGNDSCTFITFFICAYDSKSGELEFVNCGHNPPILKRSGAPAKYMELERNLVLGVFEKARFKSQSINLGSGDTILLYTDGVSEAESADGSFYGEERLLLFADKTKGTSSEIVESLMGEVLAFESGCPQSDDITIIAINRIG